MPFRILIKACGTLTFIEVVISYWVGLSPIKLHTHYYIIQDSNIFTSFYTGT